MRIKLFLMGTAIAVFAIVVALVVWKQVAKSPDPVETQLTLAEQPFLYDIPVAQKGVDWDSDGKQETLSIVMTEGKLVNYEDPGPYMGEFYVGQFSAVLKDAGGNTLQSLELAPTFHEALMFPKGTFELMFDDYNDDGYPEFTIGQYMSSNGNIYNMYTIRPEGISTVGSGIFTSSAEGPYSIRYPKASPISFLNRYYDNSRGKAFQSTFEWSGNTFKKLGEVELVFDPETGTETVPPAKEDKELGLAATPMQYGFKLNYNPIFTMSSDEIVRDGDKLAIPFSVSEDSDKSSALRRVIGYFDLASQTTLAAHEITNTTVTNIYGVSSALKVFGLIGQDELVYSNVSEEGGTQNYRIDKLNLKSGAKETLVAGFPSAPNEQGFFARNWFSPKENRIVFNQYSEGTMETFDMKTRKVNAFHKKYPHSWPLYMTIPSPDGSLFWYQGSDFRLMDLNEKVVAKVPYPEGMIDYPVWIWSDDSNYSAIHYTFDQDRKHVIDSEEIENIAPQGVRIFDRRGKEVANLKAEPKKDEYVEIAGWLPESNGVLLRYFHLYREEARKENFPIMDSSVTYKLYHLNERKLTSLENVDSFEKLPKPTLVKSAVRGMHNYILDKDAKLLWKTANRSPDAAYPISSPAGELYIVSNDAINGKAEIAKYEKATRRWTKGNLPYNFIDPVFNGENWLSSEGTSYINLKWCLNGN
ncbi:hypothetical protein D7Z26_06995 [Cohnella endophytica]|uniref:Uncharacterized protein n=1 Tax=Cohnella endophytica TaxID=2419778 RepID=A0A494XYZ3_9BACL|nr:hypothetical protein [Cohnella endophytica]RKP54978.1 hypothetical protein D7Z26_06995 [Cohnella endophytica]